jgi:hypothetical protein
LEGRAGSRFDYLLASHPHPRARIVSLQRMIADADYPLAAPVPLQGEQLLNDTNYAKVKP